MHGISEIIGLASVVTGLPIACRSIVEIVNSMRSKKQLTLVAPENKGGSERNKPASRDYLIAGSQQTSPKALALLAQSEIPGVRARVAENPNCPLALLSWLAQDSNPEVRLSVVYNPKAPPIFFQWLLNDGCADVLFALAEDHNLAHSFLEQLSQNDNPYVAERAKQTIERVAREEASSWRRVSGSSEMEPATLQLQRQY